MTVPARLSVVTVGYHDRDRLVAFYEALGWASWSPDGEFFRFETGGAWLTLYPMRLLAAEAGLPVPDPRQGGTFPGVTLAANVERAEMVDAALVAVRAAGGTVLAEPADRDWGGRSAYFADPEGNVWEVAWAPGTSFDPGGRFVWPT